MIAELLAYFRETRVGSCPGRLGFDALDRPGEQHLGLIQPIALLVQVDRVHQRGLVVGSHLRDARPRVGCLHRVAALLLVKLSQLPQQRDEPLAAPRRADLAIENADDVVPTLGFDQQALEPRSQSVVVAVRLVDLGQQLAGELVLSQLVAQLASLAEHGSPRVGLRARVARRSYQHVAQLRRQPLAAHPGRHRLDGFRMRRVQAQHLEITLRSRIELARLGQHARRFEQHIQACRRR